MKGDGGGSCCGEQRGARVAALSQRLGKAAGTSNCRPQPAARRLTSFRGSLHSNLATATVVAGKHAQTRTSASKSMSPLSSAMGGGPSPPAACTIESSRMLSRRLDRRRSSATVVASVLAAARARAEMPRAIWASRRINRAAAQGGEG